MHPLIHNLIDFFIRNTPPLRVIVTIGPLGLIWAAAGLILAGLCKRHLGWRTGYTRKIFHFFVFASVSFITLWWGLPYVCLFGGMTTLVVFYAVFQGTGHLIYEAIAREKDSPHRTYFVVAPYFATLLGGITASILFGPSAITGYLVTGIGDAIAEPIGTRFGRHPYRVPSPWGVPATRTLEGSSAVFLACLVACALAIAMLPCLVWSPDAIWKIPFFALCCAVLEAVSPHGWDNAILQIVPTGLAILLFKAGS